MADAENEVRRACAKYAVSWHPVNVEKHLAAMKRRAKIANRINAARNREATGYKRVRGKRLRATRPRVPVPDHRWR